jgi:D-alanyl-D-alanine carboxypeptidase (penicillin-binding protein 5/6)
VGGGFNNFVAMMNFKAQQLGMKNSHFKNPHGLAEDGHYMTLNDLATLTMHLYEDFPQYTHYLGITEFTYGKITQPNRHPLIKGNYEGTVGGKTGHTNEGGYGVVGVVKRDNRRLIAVVNKARTPRQRAQTITALMDYGFTKYKKLTLFRKGQTVTKMKTWLGNHSEIAAVVDRDIAVNIPASKSVTSIRVSAKYKAPLYTPIKEMSQIAKLIIEVPGYKSFEYPLFAKEKVVQVGFLRKVKRILFYKISKFINSF